MVFVFCFLFLFLFSFLSEAFSKLRKREDLTLCSVGEHTGTPTPLRPSRQPRRDPSKGTSAVDVQHGRRAGALTVVAGLVGGCREPWLGSHPERGRMLSGTMGKKI